MTSRIAVAVMIVLVSVSISLHAGEVRVDLFTRTGVGQVVVTPGTADVEICEGESRKNCLTARPGVTAKCAMGSNSIRCDAGDSTHAFRSVSAHAESVFRLDVSPRASASADAMRGVIVRAAKMRASGARLHAVAIIDIETYVTGVLAGEAATFKSPAALEAMAVVARSWAVASRGRHEADGYDFCSLTHCQFFRPPLGPEGITVFTFAAEETSGRVLKFRGKLIDAYYSAHCGGRTASAASVWPDRAAPYLVSVSDPYCAKDKRRSWNQTVSWADITQVVKEALIPDLRGTVRELIVDQKDDSGRARKLRLVTDQVEFVDANAFRYALNRRLGWNTLKSNLYDIRPGSGGLIFRGRGLGHGVGLCQTGAEQLGQMGTGFDRILAHYFPGTSVGRGDDGNSPRVLSSAHFEFHFPLSEEARVAESLSYLERELARLRARARHLAARIHVRTHATTQDFIRATGQPGWVSGSNDGRKIDLQPLKILAARGILHSTLHHELLHLVVHPLRARGVPGWYEEGMILYLTGENVSLQGTTPADSSSAASRARMQASYAKARERVAELARQRGEGALWEALERPTQDDLKWFKAAQ